MSQNHSIKTYCNFSSFWCGILLTPLMTRSLHSRGLDRFDRQSQLFPRGPAQALSAALSGERSEADRRRPYIGIDPTTSTSQLLPLQKFRG